MGLASIWGRATYPELARVVDTPTKRKGRPSRFAADGAPRSRAAVGGMVPEVHESHESDSSQPDAGSDAEELLECLVRPTAQTHAIPEAADPLVFPCAASELAPGAVVDLIKP